MATRSIDILIKARDVSHGVFGRFEKGFARFRSAIFSVKGALGGLAIGATLREAVRGFAEEEAAANRLGEALKLAGDFSQDALAKQREFAAQIQRTTTIGDEQTLAIQALGASIGKLSGVQLQQATVAAIGLSRALKIDTESAMKLVAKAAQGNTDTFTRYGIVLGDNLTAQEKFNEILRIGAENFKLATAEVQTAEGQYQQFKNAIGDVGEQVGQALVRAFTEAGKTGKSVLQILTEETADFADGLSTINAAMAEMEKRRAALERKTPVQAERERDSDSLLFRMSGRRANPLLEPVSFLGQQVAKAFTGLEDNPTTGPGRAPLRPGARNRTDDEVAAITAMTAAARAERNKLAASITQALSREVAETVASAGPIFGTIRDAIENTANTMRAIGDENRSKAAAMGLGQAMRSALEARSDAGDEDARLQLERLRVEEDHIKQTRALLEIRKQTVLTDQQRMEIDDQIAGLDRALNIAAKDRVDRRLENFFAFEQEADAGEANVPQRRQSVAAFESRFLKGTPAGKDPVVTETSKVAKAVEKWLPSLDEIKQLTAEMNRRFGQQPQVVTIAN